MMVVQRKSPRVHYLQHVPFEGPGFIESWCRSRGWQLTFTRIFEGLPLPATDDLDWLVVLGGPMNVYEEERHPWLVREKHFIDEALRKGKIVVGICLGAQLIACVMGAKVTRNPRPEIGWYPVEKTAQASRAELSRFLPDRFDAFHWHGDTFGIPNGAVHLARSEACGNQAFAFEERVIAFQFHLESTRRSVEELIRNCPGDLTIGPFVQSAEEIISAPERFFGINDRMADVFDGLATLSSSQAR